MSRALGQLWKHDSTDQSLTRLLSNQTVRIKRKTRIVYCFRIAIITTRPHENDWRAGILQVMLADVCRDRRQKVLGDDQFTGGRKEGGVGTLQCH